MVVEPTVARVGFVLSYSQG